MDGCVHWLVAWPCVCNARSVYAQALRVKCTREGHPHPNKVYTLNLTRPNNNSSRDSGGDGVKTPFERHVVIVSRLRPHINIIAVVSVLCESVNACV
jgi:hypothetical protein